MKSPGLPPSGLELQKVFDSIVVTNAELTSEVEGAYRYGDEAAANASTPGTEGGRECQADRASENQAGVPGRESGRQAEASEPLSEWELELPGFSGDAFSAACEPFQIARG